MAEKSAKPALRFAGFDDAWEQRKVGEVAKITGGNAWKSSDYIKDGEYLVITIANVTGDDYINSNIGNRLNCSNLNEYILSKNDILVSLTGNVGRVSKMTGIKAVLNQRVGKITPFEREIVPQYLFQILRNPSFERTMIDAGQGAAQKNISNGDVLSYTFKMPPSQSEQRQISDYLSSLDTLITLHQRKYDKLRSVKKSMLGKMFPKDGENAPEIRFKGFTGAWEKRKLGELYSFRRGSFPQPYEKKEWYDGEGAMPFVQVADVSDTMKLVDDTKQKISKLAQPMSVYAEKNSILVTLQGSIGRVAITQYGAFVDRTILIFEKNKADIDSSFWAYLIKQKFTEEARSAPGGTIKTITKETLSNFSLIVPNFEEQKAIGSFFRTLDSLITLNQRKLEKLQNLKKACLEKMFV